jgi:hypothetical protein
MTHYGSDGEVVGIEVLYRESDDEKISEEYGYSWTYDDALA